MEPTVAGPTPPPDDQRPDPTRDDVPVGITTGYIPALDGTRAVAVIMVVLFHLGYRWMSRGAAGVDVFFVLSGYLITSLLLLEHGRNGRISLPNFYIRRFLRLAPLSVLVVSVALILSQTTWASRLGLETPGGTALSILLYYANWWNIAVGDMGPFGHMWSLSVEEQFYLVWPLLLVGAFMVLRRRTVPVLLALTLAGALLIGTYRQWLFTDGGGRAGRSHRFPACALRT